MANDWSDIGVPASGGGWDDIGDQPQVLRAMAYGPSQGENTHDTLYGPFGHLQEGDLALSPNQQVRFPLGSYVDVLDPQTGETVLENQRIADHSYYHPNEPTHDSFEVWNGRDMGHMVLVPSKTQRQDWSAIGTPVNQQAPKAQAVQGSLEDTVEKAKRAEALGTNRLDDPRVTSVAPSQDWSAIGTPVSRHVERAQPVGAEQEAYSQSAAMPRPESTHTSDLGKFVDNIWKNAVASGAELHKGAAQATVNEPVGPNDPYEIAIKEAQVNPDLNDAQKADEIQKLRQQQSLTRQANVADIPKAIAGAKEAESQIDQDYQKTLLGGLSRTIGSTLPYVASSATGPMAGIVAATQMTASAYGETLDKSSRRLKELHPDWSDDQILVAANNAATESAKAAGESGLALSFVNIPAAGPLISRIVQKLGIADATMTLAQIYAKVQENIAIKKNVDPSQNILDGLKDVEINGLASNWLLGVPHAMGEIGARRPVETPERLTATEPLPTNKLEPEAQRGAVVEENKKTSAPESPTAEPPPIQEPIREEPVSPETTDTEPWVSAIANRYAQERSEAGEIGEIAPGEGYSRTELREAGLGMSPEEINQHVSDLMHDTGNPKLQAAAITAEEARLSQRSSQLSRVAELNTGDRQAQIDAENAFKDLTDFHNGPVAKLKNNWHAQGMTIQGEVPVDLSTFNGLREAWLRDLGKAPPESVEATMRKTAARVRVANEDETAAMQKLGQAIDESSRSDRIPSAEEVRNNIMERMGELPCVIQ